MWDARPARREVGRDGKSGETGSRARRGKTIEGMGKKEEDRGQKTEDRGQKLEEIDYPLGAAFSRDLVISTNFLIF